MKRKKDGLFDRDNHRFIKRRVNPGLGFFSFNTARRTISGYETMAELERQGIADTSPTQTKA
jgi:transposase-like protein